MSIIRVGLSETKDYSDGYDAIFGKKDQPDPKQEKKTDGEKEKPVEKSDDKK